MFISKEKVLLRNIVASLLVMAMFIQCFITPFAGTSRIAYALGTEQSEIEEPLPTETPDETEKPEPTEPQEPNDDIAQDFKFEEKYNKAIKSLVDENGFLSDESLLSLTLLPYEEEKYMDVEDNGDGTTTLKLYNSPIKFENEDGEYELIDNNIIATDSKESPDHEYKNKASDIEVLMSENLDQSGAIKMNIDDYMIGFKPLNILIEENKSSADLNFIDADQPEKKDAKLDTEEEYATLEYTETFSENTDIRITPTETGIKEDIIFNQLPQETEFSYEITLKNAAPVLRQDGNLYFIDVKNGILVAAIAAPVMWDSSEECAESYDIAVKLEITGEDTYKYTLIPDRGFLEDKNTVYPVILDPSVNSTTGQIADTFITSRYSGNNYVNDVNLKIGYGSDLLISRGLIKINQFPSILAGNSITNVKYYAYQNYSGSSTPTIQVARITSSWDPATVKWSNKPSLGSVYAQTDVQAIGWYNWDVTSLVSGWFNGTITNYGMYLMSSNESSNKYKRFYSDNNSSNKNYFAFTFTDTTAPPQPTSFSVSGSSFSGPTGSITLSWSAVTDLPVGAASGIQKYQLAIRLNDGAWSYLDKSNSSISHTYTGCLDNSNYDFAIRVYDNNNNISGWKYIYDYITPDKTGPTAPTSLSISPNSWTSNTSPVISWSGITDEGNHLQKAQYQVNSGSWTDIGTNYGVASGSYTLNASSWSDGTHAIRVRGVDSLGNTGAYASCTYYKDTTAPTASVSVGNTVLNGIVYVEATITDSGGSTFNNWTLDYGPGNPASSFNTPALATGTSVVSDQVICEWDTTGLTENTHYTIRLRAYDKAGNSATTSIILLKTSDSQLVTAGLQIDEPGGYTPDGYQPNVDDADQYVISDQNTDVEYQKAANGGVEGLSGGKLYVNNKLHDTEGTQGDDLTFNAAAYDNGWIYPEGSIAFMYVQATDSTEGELYSTTTYEALQVADAFENTSKIENDVDVELYGDIIRLKQTDGTFAALGSFESLEKSFAGDISYIDLTVKHAIPGDAGIIYEVLVSGIWQEIEPVSTDGGITVNLAKRKYFTTNPTGESVKLRAKLTKSTNNLTPTIDSWSMDIRYTTYANAVLVDNSFPKDTRGITKLYNTVHNVTNESIQLYSSSSLSGSVQSTMRLTSNDVIEACLEAEEDIPEGTAITYYISTQNGAEGSWEELTPGDASDLEDWEELLIPGTQVVLKAVLSSDGTSTPKLLSWRLSIKEKIGGHPYMVKLVDEPWNLSTLTGANYMTLLRWEASETEGVTYNVYRSTTPYFVPSEETLAAEGIEENNWNDYNLNYGQTFYYKVTAVKIINGHPRESLTSNEAWATVVSADEVTRRLGLQDYWSYAGFSTGSGTGYVNVSNGNIVYTTTDIVVSDPFLATVMRRTFNSMANTKTAMGYGWDFSFNTCLMREYSGSAELGMILKDGDGSFHRFEKDGSVYKSAKGTFMELTYNATLDEYQIKRKDNIIYHFDAQSMKLKSFSDNNGNELIFKYDDRGNLSEVENTVGDKVTLTYHVEGAAPEDPDYTYVNYHPDMLESVTWTEDTQTDPVSITYTYEYTDSDRLSRGYTTVEGNTTYAEEFAYDTSNRLITITDPEGKETDLTYDATGKVERITSANGDYYDFGYADLGENQNGTTIINQNGVSIGYEYDDEGLLYKKTDPLNNSINYTYDTNTYLVTGMSYQAEVNGTPQTISYSYAYTNGNITSINGPNGTQTTFSGYNNFNKPTSVSVKKSSSVTLTTTYTYDANGNLLATTDPMGKVTTNTYGTVNGDFGYLTQVEGDFGNQTRYTYDSKGRVTAIKEYDNGTLVRTATTYAYDYDVDGYFMRVRATDTMNNSVTTYYDLLGRKAKVLYPDGSDELWNYDLVGNMETMTNRSGNEVNYSYDDLYRMTDTTYPDDTVSSIQYLKWNSDGSGGNDADKVVKTDGAGAQTIEYYDKAGRLKKTSVSNGTTEIITAQYAYDAIGNCTQVTDNAGRVSEAEYNALGQQVKTIIDPAGANIQTQLAYDWLGNKISVTDGEGYTTSYTYDNDSRLSTVSQTVGSNTHTTSYSYDNEEGGYIKNRVTDAEERVTETWFDPMGRKIKDYNVGNTGDSTVMQTSYTYDANFRVSVVTRNDSTKEKYTYNSMGQTTRVDYYEASESTAQNSDDYIEYVYDAAGRVTRDSVYHGATEQTTTYVYDNMGRVGQMTQGSLSAGGVSVDYTYDDAGKIRELSYVKHGEQRKLGYVYDGYGRIHYITLALGSAAAKTVREYVYKTNGDLDYTKEFRNFENDGADYIITAYTLNNAGLTTGITYTDYAGGTGSGVKKEEYTMTYDKRGYITAETAYTNYTSAKTVNKTYTYDAIGRLTQATIDSKTKNYTYDKVGNRLTMSDGTDTMAYTYNQFNQLTGTTKNNEFQTSYTYDSRGNQTQEVQRHFGITKSGTTTYYNQTTNYTFNLMDHMVQADISTPEADQQGNVTYTNETSTNLYNAQGIRVKRVEKGETTNYYYSGSATLFTANANNWLLTENVLDPSGQIITSARFDDQNPGEIEGFYFYHYDKRGSTTAILKSDGTMKTGYEYDEFGNLEQSGDSNFLNDVTFTGSVTDKSTGLQYMNARFYNSSTGRFLSQDTYTGNPYDPWTQHLYSYCMNNPTNFIDPTGHEGVADSYRYQSNMAARKIVPTGSVMDNYKYQLQNRGGDPEQKTGTSGSGGRGSGGRSGSGSDKPSIGYTESVIETSSYPSDIMEDFDFLGMGVITLKATESTITKHTQGTGGSNYTIDTYTNTNLNNGMVKIGASSKGSNGTGENVYAEWIGVGYSKTFLSKDGHSLSGGFQVNVLENTGVSASYVSKLTETTNKATTISLSVNTLAAATVVLAFVIGPEAATRIQYALGRA